jgi:hypothetical protein
MHALRKPIELDIRRIAVSGACFLWLKTVPEKEKMITTLPGLFFVPYFSHFYPLQAP